jgi:hypothetical protein
MEMSITKYRLAINWYMLLLALAIITNALTQVVLMIMFAPLPKFIIGFAISFIGLFLYGFHFFWQRKRVLYQKAYKVNVAIKPIVEQIKEPELSRVFVTEEGRLLE